jgi:hypothetical protein
MKGRMHAQPQAEKPLNFQTKRSPDKMGPFAKMTSKGPKPSGWFIYFNRDLFYLGRTSTKLSWCGTTFQTYAQDNGNKNGHIPFSGFSIQIRKFITSK